MKKPYILICILLMMSVVPVCAQKKKTTKAKAKVTAPVQPQKTAADLLYENMLTNIQRVFVVDSIVVDTDQLLTAIPLPADNGTLHRYNDFFDTDNQPGQYVYVNGFRNKCFYSEADDDDNIHLFTRDKIAGRWSEPQELEGIADFSLSMAFPFMMADGTTFYFAAKGKESIGGFDIFITRYDAESQRYLKPENIGLPLNSKADDLLYVEDDLNQLAWLATNRNQPEGKVCVYTIVPADNRQNYDIDELSDERLEQLASISSIKDTWPSPAKRAQAMKRLQNLKNSSSANNDMDIRFPINDQTVYTSLSQFRSDETRNLFLRMKALDDKVSKEIHHLDLIRKEYRHSEGETRQRLADDITDYERIILRQQKEIKLLAKQIRNKENL